MKTIPINKAFELTDAVFIDARSPKEFSIDNIPDSVNLPVLDDEERKEVGIAFKQNQKKAWEIGIEHYKKKLPTLVDFISKIDKKKPVIVYCWRGGSRSRIIANLIELMGFETYQLDGGYKSYRSHVRKELENIKLRFIVLYGLAGSGKTELIRRLNNSLDLEGLAQHRSSVFGAIGLKPRSQKMFESLLLKRLKELDDDVVVEGESRKIGDIIIPDNIFKMMKKGINIKINCSVNNRVKQIMKDYFQNPDADKIKKIVNSLKQKIGKKMMNEILELIDKNDYEELSRRLLTEYYDKIYAYTVDSANCIYEFNNDDIDECLKELEKIRDEITKQFSKNENKRI